MSNQLLEAAIKYATKYGWAVFPVGRNKKPLTPNGCKDAKKTTGAIKAWWKRHPDASIGIATGSISNLIVIDEDVDEDKGLDGIRSVREWENINGELPATVMAITGRGGSHMYYRYTGSDIKNRPGLLEGVDVRGEGGYVIAPPSLHQNGTNYQWEYDPDEVQIADLNESVKRFLQLTKSGSFNRQSFDVPEQISSGSRNDTLYRLACSLQAQGLPDSAIYASVSSCNQERCIEPLPEDELENLISSALTHEKGVLRIVRNGIGEYREPNITYKLDRDGNATDMPAQTIANAEEAIKYDKDLFGHIFYNELAYSPYVYGNIPWKTFKGWREWTNEDDSNLRSYIEKRYGLKNAVKTMDALTNVVSKLRINPIKTMLESCYENWDGNSYIEDLLPDMLGAEKNEYTIAVMKVFMLGAIHRIFQPGCKFDYMLVLVGEQGGGKSSFLRFLALNDSWFNDNFSTLDGTRAIENLRGMWIVELAELQAAKRVKDVETIKSFITSRVDTYRVPYGRRTEQRKRMCVLAGTSNPVDFLTDRTGNRRFLPVTCSARAPTFDMFADELATKERFTQAWGEAMMLYKQANGRPRLVLPANLQRKALEEQERYQEENPYIGIIQEWLDKTAYDRVCALMLWREALGHNDYDRDPDRRILNMIHEIMKNNITGWICIGKQRLLDVAEYGVQKCYEREKKDGFIELPASETTPFDS